MWAKKWSHILITAWKALLIWIICHFYAFSHCQIIILGNYAKEREPRSPIMFVYVSMLRLQSFDKQNAFTAVAFYSYCHIPSRESARDSIISVLSSLLPVPLMEREPLLVLLERAATISCGWGLSGGRDVSKRQKPGSDQPPLPGTWPPPTWRHRPAKLWNLSFRS